MFQSSKIALINFILLFVLIFNLSLHQVVLGEINKSLGIKSAGLVGISILTKKQAGSSELSGELVADAIKLVIAQGVPEIYGPELGVSFDQAQNMINILKQFDPTYGRQKIVLTGEGLQRYIEIGLRISCEYCCGAKAIVNTDGRAACGCAHSQAMRGLAAYLIQNHGSDYNNDEILRELARWKGVFFPKQMIKKMVNQLQGGQKFTPDTASLIMGYGLPDYGRGGGGSIPLPSEIKDLPSMVGGC